MTTPLYKKALIIGATSGIGAALASKLLTQGTKVVVVGRRRERLDQFVSTHGSDKAAAVPFDITQLSEIPTFAASIIKQHPDLDYVVFNSGIQRAFDFSRPSTVDLNTVDEELTANYTSQVHSFLQQQKTRATLVYISATLGIVPGLLRTGNYNASKGALHNWIMVLREQLKAHAQNNVKVIEVFPPAVQTELHDERHQPDLKDSGSLGMALDAFVDETYQGLSKNEDQIGVGHGKAILDSVETARKKAFYEQIESVKVMLAKYLK